MRKKEIDMSSKYADDSLALHTDLYQINMAESYWADGIHERKAVFELFSETCRSVMAMRYLRGLSEFSII